jgi:xanthine dehydrogenase YagR molybdenum-binding subunit
MADKIKTTVGWPGHTETREIELPDGEPPPWDGSSQLKIVSGRVPRVDAPLKVTGRAKYTWDLRPPGLLFARVLRSPHPSARVAKIDLAKAKAAPGVRAVWSEPAGKKLLYQGQEVAAVAATSLDEANDALALIEVEWEKQPHATSSDAARKKGAPQVFPAENQPPPRRVPSGAEITHDGNMRTIISSEPHGADLERAFREADVVVEATYRTQVQTHSPLETHGAIARWEADTLTLWTSTQATFGVRDQLAEALQIPHEKVRVLCDYMGGGFGAKLAGGPYSLIAARLSKDAKAPVQVMLNRHEEHLVGGNRPDSTQWLKLGAKKDGTLVALHLKSYGSAGVGVGAGVAGPMRSLYKIGAVRTEESDVFTNAGAAAPFRAPGHPQGCFSLEQAIDELADKLGMDPIALRKKNLKNPVQAAELDRMAQKLGERWSKRGKAGGTKSSVRRGIGLACGLWYKNVNPNTQVEIVKLADGRFEVRNGAQDIGTGTRTLLAQIAAEELGVPMEKIVVRMGDTSLPHGPASGGSSTAPSLAPAVRAAAYKLKQGGKSATAPRAREYDALQDQIGGVQVAEVEVDTETGQVRVLRVTAIQDCGRPINRLTSESQVNGGIIQGVSYALFEHRVLDDVTGQMCNPTFDSYKILTANDCPEIDVELFEFANAGNNTSTAGIGEPTTVPTSAAIANAVHHALGVRVRELPLGPERILAALRGGK